MSRSGRARVRWTMLAAIAALAAGCGGSHGGDQSEPAGGASEGSDEAIVREWSAAVNRGDYDRAADLFADGAVVEQVGEITLETHAEAVAFNRGLPCRADVTDVEEQEGGTLAAFELREGPTGACRQGGSARVLFVISDGEIEEWRQLPEPPAPEGDTV